MSVHLSEIAALFQAPGEFVSAEPLGDGHINETHLAKYAAQSGAVHLVHQKINTEIFREPEAMMQNIVRVTEHVEQKLSSENNEHRQRALRVIPANDGRAFAYDSEGGFWRTFNYIENTRTYGRVDTPDLANKAGFAFGRFVNQLSDLPGPRLSDSIPNFHDGPLRLQALKDAVRADPFGRTAHCQEEIAFAFDREVAIHQLSESRSRGDLPERVTHNDTKVNNLLFDIETGESVCVVDLDTVMPGLLAYDFGDLVRTATSPTDEDTTDLSQVGVRTEMYRALADGYLSGAGNFVTQSERESLFIGGKFITLTIGIRFLTDFLSGDKYFRIHHENHNLERCRTQFVLVSSLENHEDTLKSIT